MAKRMLVNIRGETFQCDGGDHVLLSLEDYNKIVRSLNLLTVLASSIETIEDRTINNALQVLRAQSLPVIEDE